MNEGVDFEASLRLLEAYPKNTIFLKNVAPHSSADVVRLLREGKESLIFTSDPSLFTDEDVLAMLNYATTGKIRRSPSREIAEHFSLDSPPVKARISEDINSGYASNLLLILATLADDINDGPRRVSSAVMRARKRVPPPTDISIIPRTAEREADLWAYIRETNVNDLQKALGTNGELLLRRLEEYHDPKAAQAAKAMADASESKRDVKKWGYR